MEEVTTKQKEVKEQKNKDQKQALEEGFELAFSHPWFAIPHYVAMRLGCDLGRPAHCQDLVIVLEDSRLDNDIMQGVVVDAQIGQVGLLRDHGLQLRVAIHAPVHVDRSASRTGACGCHELLQLVYVAHFELVLRCVLLFAQNSHPDLVQGVKLGHEENGLFLCEVKQAVAIHL